MGKAKIDKDLKANFGELKKADGEDIVVGDKVKVIAEVNGMPPGHTGEVVEVKIKDSLFRVNMLTGPKAEVEEGILIKANDLEEI
jgi:hypothetical protein